MYTYVYIQYLKRKKENGVLTFKLNKTFQNIFHVVKIKQNEKV